MRVFKTFNDARKYAYKQIVLGIFLMVFGFLLLCWFMQLFPVQDPFRGLSFFVFVAFWGVGGWLILDAIVMLEVCHVRETGFVSVPPP